MKKILDELNEIVYIIELKTYKLLYLNAYGLDLFGYKNFNEVKNHKCFEIFYKKDFPCSFCNVNRISEKESHQWECKNPIINKYLLKKEKLIKWNGKIVHLVTATDITKKENEKIILEQTLKNEKIVLECIKMMHSSSDISTAINNTLETMGNYLNGERAYIFELNKNNTLDNTYEWCAEGIMEAKNSLQNISLVDFKRWIDKFIYDLPIVIENLEDIKEIEPIEYSTLKPQGIHSLIVLPIIENNNFHGLFGIDNPPKEKMKNIIDILRILSYFFLEMLQRKNLLLELENLSYYDSLTGALNRNAFIKTKENFSQNMENGLGILFIDVNGLKDINDNIGHTAGDELIINVFKAINKIFIKDSKYRIGGDEFIVFSNSMTYDEFSLNVLKLKQNLKSSNGPLASIGHIWASKSEKIDNLIKIAEEKMYVDKKIYHNKKVKLKNKITSCTEK
ncbi:diguanylate cyclase [Fusobacterium varium]|nr:diguanylate cyclase [Fusobacterium varium]